MKRTEGLEMDGFKVSVGIGQLHGGSGNLKRTDAA